MDTVYLAARRVNCCELYSVVLICYSESSRGKIFLIRVHLKKSSMASFSNV